MSLAQVLQQSGVIESMARELNIDEQTARTGAGALLPAIVAGMGRQSTSSSGLGGLGSILGGLTGGGQASGGGLGGGLSGGPGGGLGAILLDQVLKRDPTPTQPGNDILGQIFGTKDVSRGVAEEAAGSTGIDQGLLKKMLPILAMAVVGYMMKQKSGGQKAGGPASGGPESGGLAQNGGLGGALGGLLGQIVTGMTRR